jgi:hypothetical protein
MSVLSRWLFILIGNDRTGKTTVQRRLVELLNGQHYTSLPSDRAYDLNDFAFRKKCRRFFVAGRSYQEPRGTTRYRSVQEYFARAFDGVGADICLGFMASHLEPQAVREMIDEAHDRFWNVCGIFLSNGVASNQAANQEISRLGWDERWYAENPSTDDEVVWNRQLNEIAESIMQMLIERTRGW